MRARSKLRRQAAVAAVAVLGVAGAAGAVLVAVSGDEPDPGPEVTVPDVDPDEAMDEVTASDGRRVQPASDDVFDAERLVVIDGWSERVAGDAGFTVVTAGGSTRTLEIAPASASQIAKIAERDPDAVTRVAARLVSNDPDVSCTADGCSDSSGEIPFSQLAKPGSAGVFADMYDGWGIYAGVWVAAADDVVSVAGVPASTSVTTVAAGFGEVFALDPLWLDGGDRDQLRAPLASISAPPSVSEVPLAAGPAVADPAARALTSSQLTALSSPTVGCGVGVLCAPEPAEGGFDLERTAEFVTCDSAGQFGETQLAFVAHAGDVDVVVRGPIHQVDAGAPGDDGVGDPVLLSSQLGYRVTRVDVYDATGLVAVAGPIGSSGAWDEDAVRGFLGDRFSDCDVQPVDEPVDDPAGDPDDPADPEDPSDPSDPTDPEDPPVDPEDPPVDPDGPTDDGSYMPEIDDPTLDVGVVTPVGPVIPSDENGNPQVPGSGTGEGPDDLAPVAEPSLDGALGTPAQPEDAEGPGFDLVDPPG